MAVQSSVSQKEKWKYVLKTAIVGVWNINLYLFFSMGDWTNIRTIPSY